MLGTSEAEALAINNGLNLLNQINYDDILYYREMYNCKSDEELKSFLQYGYTENDLNAFTVGFSLYQINNLYIYIELSEINYESLKSLSNYLLYCMPVGYKVVLYNNGQSWDSFKNLNVNCYMLNKLYIEWNLYNQLGGLYE